MNLVALIDRMISAGMSPGEAGSIAAEIYAAGVASATVKTSGAARQQRYRERHQTSQSVTSLRSDEASQNVTNRNETSQSDALPNPPISTSKIKSRERQNRGTRIASDWSPSDAERAFAKQEGFSDWEVQRETQKFRDYWSACAGAKGVKLDWSATWRQWIRNGADRAGKTPAPSGQGAAAGLLYYAKPESEQLAAWDAWAIKANGKSLPRDKNGGWNVKAEWPPEYVRPEKLREMSATPLFRSM